MTIHSSSSIDAPRSTRITGSAVETTRLSSTTMNRAIDVMTNVQAVRVPAFIGTSLSFSGCYLVSYYSAVEKKEKSLHTSSSLQPSARRASHESVPSAIE